MSPSSDSQLFRQQAVDEARVRPQGQIVLRPGASTGWAAAIAGVLMCAVIALLVLGSYTRRATVSGQLMPKDGLIRVSAQQGGLLAEKLVREGDTVRRGQPLLVLTTERIGGLQGTDVQGQMAAQIEQRRQLLEDERRRSLDAQDRDAAQLRQRVQSLQDERPRLARQIQEQQGRVALSSEALARYRRLFQQEVVTRDELQAREADASEQRTRLEALRRESAGLDREIQTTQREMQLQGERAAATRAELQRGALMASQELTELEGMRRTVITAPADGRLTLVQAELGQRIEPGKALVHIVPAGAPLHARLYVPSRAAGFIKPGMRVMVRYDAYPYQKFGQHEAKVASVSRVAVAPSELSGIVVMPDSPMGMPPAESLFAVDVALPAQALGSGNDAQPLHAGMRIEADLLQETRRLYEWMLEPLYAARGRLSN